MKRLSKKQEQVLIILCEGSIIRDIQDHTLHLEDADKNSYYLRHDTFWILFDGGFIKEGHAPTINHKSYNLSERGKEYLVNHCLEEIQDFL
jgi:hypothetical protein